MSDISQIIPSLVISKLATNCSMMGIAAAYIVFHFVSFPVKNPPILTSVNCFSFVRAKKTFQILGWTAL